MIPLQAEDVSLEATRREGGLTMTVGGVDVMGWQVEDVPMRRVGS